MSYNINTEETYLTRVNTSNQQDELEQKLFKSKLFKTNLNITDKDKTTKFGTTNPTNLVTNHQMPVISLNTHTHLSPLNPRTPNESRDHDHFKSEKINEEMISHGLIGLTSGPNVNKF
jgi:hypothetical protein